MKWKLYTPRDQLHKYRISSSSPRFELIATVLRRNNIPLHQYNDSKKVLNR